jgi:hypothetical protein
MTTYQPTLSGALAHEHVTDLLRQAATSRAAAQLPDDPTRHRTPRRRSLWWVRVTARTVTARTV